MGLGSLSGVNALSGGDSRITLNPSMIMGGGGWLGLCLLLPVFFLFVF